MGRGRAWSAEETEWLLQNWERPDAELCEHLGRPLGTIRTKRGALGLTGKRGRRKSDWTQEELDYLAEVWGEKTIPQIAKRLGRSLNAVRVKSKRLGYCSQKWSGGMMSARKVSELLGVDIHTVTDYWIPKCGLKGQRKKLDEKGSATIIFFEALLRWLENNQDKWDSRRVERYALGMEYEWLKAKRKADALLPACRLKRWTQPEDAEAIRLFKRGDMTYQEIGNVLGRSRESVERRISRLDVWGDGSYIGNKRWEDRKRRKDAFEMRALRISLLALLKARFNELNFDGYWQKESCMRWHPVKGCAAGCDNCDSCAEFERIRPQYCSRCGATFYERQRAAFCNPCRVARKKKHQRRYAAMAAKGAQP